MPIELPPSSLVVALSISAFIVISIEKSAEMKPANDKDQVAYQGSLRFTSDNFTETLRDKDSLDYIEREDKYGDMVSCIFQCILMLLSKWN